MIITPRTRRAALVMAAISATLATTVLWQSTAPAAQVSGAPTAPTRIAVINIDIVLKGLTEYTQGMAELESKNVGREAQIKAIIDEHDQLALELEETVMTRDQERELKIKMIELQGQLTGMQQAFTGAAQEEHTMLLTDLYSKMVLVVQKVAVREGIDLVLVDDTILQPPAAITGRRIIYRNENLDISQIVLTEMNTAFDVGANP